VIIWVIMGFIIMEVLNISNLDFVVFFDEEEEL
jgi:hypothetical protein